MALACCAVLLLPAPTVADEISFDRDIRPILSENCFHCHGPDEENREADLALHQSDAATAVIEPGDPASSELIARIFDEDDPMPPVDSNRALTAKQKELLKQWIAAGANYEAHWAFTPPQKPAIPNESANENPIDHFVRKRLNAAGLQPADKADRETLARRASLALTGLHPTPTQMQAFLADESADAYERLVDRLLDSDDYAERMTLFWLDAARYADTDGYQNDFQRNNWPWRDWVIAAFRDNMPFDRFTIEQLAGDMLPNATHSQRLATAFNRNHRQNSEGGALAEEFFVENVIDRVETTSTVWLGLTAGCARCHDHKYDPISQREFYQLFAYFNNIGERGIGKGFEANPILPSTSPIRELPASLAKKRAGARQRLAEAEKSLPTRFDDWCKRFSADQFAETIDWHNVEPARQVTVKHDGVEQVVTPAPDGSYQFEKYSSKKVSYRLSMNTSGQRISGVRFEILPTTRFSAEPRFAPSINGNFVVTGVAAKFVDHRNRAQNLNIHRAEASYEQRDYAAANLVDDNPHSGWAVHGADATKPLDLRLQLEQPIVKDDKGRLEITLEHNSQFANHTIGQFRLAFTTHPTPVSPPDDVLAALAVPRDDWDESRRQIVRQFYRKIDAELAAAQKNQQAAEAAIKAAGFGNVPVMVMNESEEIRPAYLLNRGQYTDPDKSTALPRAVPAALLPDGSEQPSDRLELARWLTSRENPITARVVVNRIWQRLFGIGLVKTSEDFGSQGERPSHPQLLDWLAVEFIDSGWNVKHLYRLIATSKTFRQSSRITPKLHALDPENRLLARGPRYRMDGFALRDMALQSAGLLNRELGGAPVKPYQPAGLWSTVGNSAGDRYVPDKGGKLYRKSMYTYWRRAVNPPRQLIFDASGREVCNVRQRVTNTPLQALALMNDETFVEAARHLAARMLKQSDSTPTERLTHGYTLATSYQPDEQTLEVLADNLAFFVNHYQNDEQAAREFLSIGDSPADKSLDPSTHAAYAATAHLILNLDETLVLE